MPKNMMTAAAALLLALPAFVSAQDASAIALSGDWSGQLSGRLKLVLHVSALAEGGWTATLDSPDQGAIGLKVDKIEVEDRTVRFILKAPAASFEATLSEDGTKLEGHWKQGQDIPLVMTRTSEVPTVFSRPQTPELPYPYRSETIEVEHTDDTGPVTLAGTLTKPEGKGPFPAVILISGSGQQDRDETIMGHKPFLVLADHLTRQGCAVLRFDDRGVGDSKGNVKKATSAHFAGDVVAFYDRLTKHEDIDAARIGLIGHSEGGMISAITFTRRPKVAFIVMLAGTGVKGRAVIEVQSRAIMVADGLSEEAANQQLALTSKIWDRIEESKASHKLQREITKMFREYHDALPEEKRAELPPRRVFAASQAQQVNSPWFHFFLKNDPAQWIEKVSCPVLVLNGGKDLQVHPEQNPPAIAEALAKGGNRAVTVRIFPDLNHLFQTAETGSPTEYATIEETFAPAALQAVSSWLQSQF